MTRFFDLMSLPARESLGFSSSPSANHDRTNAGSSMIRLDANENPFGPSPLAVEAAAAALNISNLYPDDDSIPLRRKIADVHMVTRIGI